MCLTDSSKNYQNALPSAHRICGTTHNPPGEHTWGFNNQQLGTVPFVHLLYAMEAYGVIVMEFVQSCADCDYKEEC